MARYRDSFTFLFYRNLIRFITSTPSDCDVPLAVSAYHGDGGDINRICVSLLPGFSHYIATPRCFKPVFLLDSKFRRSV
jgi:hypothetical protein